MSALAGYWDLEAQANAAQLCGKMLAAQRIYGPDHSNVSDCGEAALGRNLFRLLPEDRFDRQPLSGAGGRYTLVADVRLDNRDALIRTLGLDGAALADADLVLAAWERWQDDAFDHLYGDYAFAVWDADERKLVLARDALGGRPLHYHLAHDFIAFASMPKGLQALEAMPSGPDEVRSLQFLSLLPEWGPRSFFEGISRVELGQVVTIGTGGVSTRTHWNPVRRTPSFPDFESCAEAVRHELDRAVAVRLRGAERHVGAHLSAGLDSAGVAATAARLLGPSDGRVTAFTAVPREGYDGKVRSGAFGDESILAGDTAALYPNMEHVLVRPDGQTILDRADRDFYLFDRPLANAQVWQFWNRINEEGQKRGLQVMLNGGFGNLGISYDGWPLFAELAGQRRFLKLFREAQGSVRSGHVRWRAILSRGFGHRIPAGLWKWLQSFRGLPASGLETSSMIHPDRIAEVNIVAKERKTDFHYRPVRDGFESRLRTMRAIDFGNNRKGVLGGWGIDLRDPTADRRLLELCLSIPTEYYLRDGTPRALALRVLADRLPQSVLNERRRGAQAVDLHEQLTADRERLREEIERLRNVPAASASLDLDRMCGLIDDWPEGGWHSDAVRRAYDFALLRGIVVGQFLRKASRGNG